MNAIEISPKVNSRLSRIKIVSRVARLIVFCFFVFTIWFLLKVVFGLFRERNFNVLTHEILLIILQGILCVWYWKLAQLFRFYGRGLIFAAETIRCIKFLGLLCAVDWIFKSAIHILDKQYPPPTIQSLSDIKRTLPPGVILNKISVTHYQMGFFSFDFGTGIDFGLLFAGIVIVLIAWIMDEGRKIQEEQELTV